MKILVTGANGLLGQKLVTLLQNIEGVELTATGKGLNRNPPGDYTFLSANLLNHEGVRTFISLTQPDVIIHCAAMTQVDECELNQKNCWAVNVDATENLINIAKDEGIYFLYVSTDFVFDGLSGPYREEDLPSPVSFYGESKTQAEELVRASGISWAIVRTVLVYGVAHDPSRSNIVLWVKKSLEEGKEIQVVEDQWRTPTLAEDLALGIWLIVKKQKTGIFHISGSETMTPYSLSLKVADFFQLDQGLIAPTDAYNFKQPAKRPPKTGFIIHKARRELGFQPRSFEEGLELVQEQLAQQDNG